MFHICLDRDAPATKEEVEQSRAEQSRAEHRLG
jgi:hypothetical protein